MLRSRARVADKRKLRTIFENLRRLKAERKTSVTEIAVPGGGTAPAPEMRWGSVDDITAAAGPESKQDSVRMFEQVMEPAVFLRPEKGMPLPEKEGAKKPSIMDAATGMDAVCSSTKDLRPEEIFLLRRLTTAMVWANNPSPKAAAEVFARLRMLELHPKLLRLLTPYAWKFIWAMETEQIPTLRTKLIGDMMVTAGAEFTEEQDVAYIGGLFWNEAGEAAVERWEALVKRHPTPVVFNLGVRIFSLARDLVSAEQVIAQQIETLGSTEHKTWIPIIMGYNHLYEGETAWKRYKTMHSWAKRNNEPITARQYDDLAMSFLDSMQPAMGLNVYKDMIYAGYNALDRQQTETYQNLSNAVKAAQRQTVDPKTLNDISLDALKTLPPRIADKFFYGGWMLNLMRMGRTDLAWFLVTDTMHKQGFPPDSIHTNWCIQGFLQEGNVDMAEEIADAMINSRLGYVAWKRMEAEKKEKRRNGEVSGITEGPTVDQVEKEWEALRDDALKVEAEEMRKAHDIEVTPTKVGGWRDRLRDNRKQRQENLATEFPTGKKRTVAHATVQTFSLLIHFYARRKRMERIITIVAKMLDCDISANSYIMNHLLYSLFRVSDLEKLALTFISMVTKAQVRPDMESFIIMWTAMWRHYTQPKRKSAEYLSHRQLFALTVQHLPTRNFEDSGKMKDVWYTMIKSFLLARDLEGTLLALHSGRKLWNVEVDETVVREVAFGVLRSRPWDPEVTGGRPRVDSGVVAQSVESLRHLGREISLQRGRKRGPHANADRRRPLKISMEVEGTLESLTVLLRKELGRSNLVLDDLLRAKADMGLQKVKFNEDTYDSGIGIN